MDPFLEVPPVLWYVCITCDNIVDGPHECKKIVNKYILNCGCKITVTDEYTSFYSLKREKFRLIKYCIFHGRIKKRKIYRRKIGKNYVNKIM